MIAWFCQRISAVALLFLIAVHIWNLHYGNPEQPPEYTDLVRRLKTWGYISLDISLLVFCLYHGLNGARNIVLDYTKKEKIIRRWTMTLTSIGIVFSVMGSMAIVKILTMG